MLNAKFIIVDLSNIVVGYIAGGNGASIDDPNMIVYPVAYYPDPVLIGGWYWDAKNEEYIPNPDYDAETAAGKIYYPNVGWVYPEPEPEPGEP